jgi:HAD superfamily hydrolase (TIGR01509 family)
MTLRAVIFDMDGTLVDTNSAHVEAWQRAFGRCGFCVPVERITPEIGKGGDMLVPAVLGDAEEKEIGETLRQYHSEEFLRITSGQHFKVFPQVPELVDALRRRGLKVALASSAKREQLEATQESARIDLEAMMDSVITSDDADKSKPAPDLVLSAAKKLELSPAECAMVGDTPHDAEACRRAGVAFLGVLTGGHTVETLTAAGARAAWHDTADLLNHLDEALKIASNGFVNQRGNV